MEDTLQHLGPSAQPLMSFLYKKDAANFLTTNKYIAELVSAYQKRWGFKKPIFTVSDHYYRLGCVYHPALLPGEYLVVEVKRNKSCRITQYEMGYPSYPDIFDEFDADKTVQVVNEIIAHGYPIEIKKLI